MSVLNAMIGILGCDLTAQKVETDRYHAKWKKEFHNIMSFCTILLSEASLKMVEIQSKNTKYR